MDVNVGTEKYPQESEFYKFISAHGGTSNARTYSDHTSYHFDIKPDQLQEALDRFAQFFIAPKFAETATEREVQTIESELSKYLNDDTWRILQVMRYLSKPGHDYGKFNIGCK
ncbi:peptidase, M16 family, partial [Ostertagia ostertagi]